MRHDLTLRVPGYDIPAALEIPDGAAGNVAGAVLLIPGSLFINVDGDFPAWNSFPRVYAFLAEQMATRGLVVYRFAKLGPGTGSTEAATGDPSAIRNWAGRAKIAHAALVHFREELAARSLTPRKLVLAGHSEGAVVASVIATQGAEVDAVVLLSGPSVGILGIMEEQARGMDRPMRLEDMPPDAQKYLRECDATDPTATIALYEKPVLIVQGGNDSSVPTQHSEKLRDARGSKPTTYKFFPGLQHMYKLVPPGMTNQQEIFSLTGPTDLRIAEAVDSFVRAL